MPTHPSDSYVIKRRAEARQTKLSLQLRLWTLNEPREPLPDPDFPDMPVYSESQYLMQRIAEQQAVIDEANQELGV